MEADDSNFWLKLHDLFHFEDSPQLFSLKKLVKRWINLVRDFKNVHSTSVSTRSSVDGHKIILLYSHKLPVGYTMSMYTPYNDFFKLTDILLH